MRLPRITALLLALAASPALAIDSDPDESAEDDTELDTYIPNRFAITAHGEWAHFNQHHDVEDTGGGGLRVGFRINRWAELEFGADFYQMTSTRSARVSAARPSYAFVLFKRKP